MCLKYLNMCLDKYTQCYTQHTYTDISAQTQTNKDIPLKHASSMETSQLFQFKSVQSFSRVRLFATPWIAAHQASLSIINSQSYPNSCPLSWWCHPTISSLPSPSPPACNLYQHQGLFKCQFFTSGGQRIGVWASISVLPMNTQDWTPLGLTGWISLQSKGLPRVFSNTTVQKHQFFSSQLSL